MSYLKIFPRSLIVKVVNDSEYVGRLTYDFEQYGRMVYDDDSMIVLQQRCQPHLNWLIKSTGQVHNLAGFHVFMKALNHYLFEMIHFDPITQFCRSTATEFEFYFERVYFDMGLGEFISVQKMTVLNSGEAKRAFKNLNVRS